MRRNEFCKVVRVIDGDTIEAEADCGFGIRYRDKFRLLGINAPEIRTVAGEQAKNALAARIEAIAGLAEYGVELITHKTSEHVPAAKRDKYGRWLAEIVDPQFGTVNHYMMVNEFAVPYLVDR